MALEKKTIVYYDYTKFKKCFSEFEYFHKCASEDYEIDMPQVKGAIYIRNCIGEEECSDTSTNGDKKLESNLEFPHNSVTVTGNYFFSNSANIVLSKMQTENQASALYIVGGKRNVIERNTFSSQKGPFSVVMQNYAYDIYSFMPKRYFVYSQAPVMRIEYPED